MTDKEKIEEMGVDICKGCNSRLDPTFKCDRNVCAMAEVVSEYLIDMGWTKIIWHKVADGTWKFIPRDMMLLFVIRYEDINTGEMIKQVIPGSIDSESNCCHSHCASSKDTLNNRNTEGIIAWTELPTYEEK